MGKKKDKTDATTMVKKDIVNAVSELTLYSQEDVKPIVEAVFYVMRTFLEKAPAWSNIEIRGFGTFTLTVTPERQAHLGHVPEMRRIKFRPGERLRTQMHNMPTKKDFLDMKY